MIAFGAHSRRVLPQADAARRAHRVQRYLRITLRCLLTACMYPGFLQKETFIMCVRGLHGCRGLKMPRITTDGRGQQESGGKRPKQTVTRELLGHLWGKIQKGSCAPTGATTAA